MARFIFTMNMPAKSGNAVHQVVGESAAYSLRELVGLSNMSGTNTWVLVDEIYRDGPGGDDRPNGQIAINLTHVGKIKEAV